MDTAPETEVLREMAPRDESLLIRLSASEKEGFQAAAAVAGISVSAWIRERLRVAATRELEAASKPIPFLLDREE